MQSCALYALPYARWQRTPYTTRCRNHTEHRRSEGRNSLLSGLSGPRAVTPAQPRNRALQSGDRPRWVSKARVELFPCQARRGSCSCPVFYEWRSAPSLTVAPTTGRERDPDPRGDPGLHVWLLRYLRPGPASSSRKGTTNLAVACANTSGSRVMYAYHLLFDRIIGIA